jgi:D-aspartate ligase
MSATEVVRLAAVEGLPRPASRHMDRSPVLLSLADYYGTLAAVRGLGRMGVPVVMAEWRLLPPARWSRYVSRVVRCPPVSQSDRFVDWLLDFGRREPGHVLCATSDELAWIYSRHREELSRHFQIYQPSHRAVYSLLNKRLLHQACGDSGIEVPPTWFPESFDDVTRLEPEVMFPVAIKPRIRVLCRSQLKGVCAASRVELAHRYRAFAACTVDAPRLTDGDPAAVWPIIQTYFPEAAERVYSLSGFIDQSGRYLAVRAARKILQSPRSLGVGVCFEAAPVDSEVCARFSALCRSVGYFGVFEAEFIEAGGRRLLIDVNPRFYGQMAFELARHLPLPLMAYRAALGDWDGLRAAVEESRVVEGAGGVYCHRLLFEILLNAQRWAGRLSAPEAAAWRQWIRSNRGRSTNPVADAQDPLPAVIDFAYHVQRYARHPGDFLRSFMEG